MYIRSISKRLTSQPQLKSRFSLTAVPARVFSKESNVPVVQKNTREDTSLLSPFFEDQDFIPKSFRKIFDDALSRNKWDFMTDETAWFPRLDLEEDKDNYHLSLDLPGMKKEKIKVQVENNVVSISGKRERESVKEGSNFKRTERMFGNFKREFTVPEDSDPTNLKAELVEGVLKLTLPKCAPKVKGKIIEVK